MLTYIDLSQHTCLTLSADNRPSFTFENIKKCLVVQCIGKGNKKMINILVLILHMLKESYKIHFYFLKIKEKKI